MKHLHLLPTSLLLLCGVAATDLIAQQAPAVSEKAQTGGARPAQMNQGFIGRDVPHFDPGNDTVAYDGKLWNINDNRLFRARFEKYLNAPEENSEEDIAYRKTIEQILDLLKPGNATKQNQDAAYALLPKASQYRDDANLCSTLADAIYTAANSRVEIQRLEQKNDMLEKQRKIAEFNNLQASRDNPLSAAPVDKNEVAAFNANQKIEREARMGPTQRELSEVGQMIQNNKARIAVLEFNGKGHLQALILQFFATRRFQHVIIANRFYRALFNDGDNSIDTFKKMVNSVQVSKDAGQVKMKADLDPKIAAAGETGGNTGNNNTGVSAGTGGASAGVGGGTGNNAPSGSAVSGELGSFGVENVSVESLVGGAANAARAVSRFIDSLSQLDGLANEAIRDVNEGVEAYKFLLSKNELKSATERLAETFAMGEYMPSVRLLTREEKRRALEFSQKSNELLAALEVNDLTRAATLVDEIQKLAGDFDSSKPLAKIETAKAASGMHLAKAKMAASKGDQPTLESELRQAAEIWPRNPALAEVSTTILNQSDTEQQTLGDFDRLLSQKNYRQIYDDKVRYIGAISLSPERQEKLKAVLDRMQIIETSIMRSQEIARRGDYAGAWEGLEITFGDYSDDPKLNQMRADLTTQAPEFVRDLREAKSYEEKKEYGSALAWYLRAQNRYPGSDLSRQGISRVVKQILPDAS